MVAKGKDDIRKGIAKEVQQRIDSGVSATIEKILAMEPIDAMKEASSVIGRKGPYKNLSEQDAKKILQDTEDHIFERNVDLDPEDMFADGGRIGFKKGMTRRQFLEIMGGIGAAGVAAKTGILKLLGKTGAKQATKQAIITPPVAGKPAWFDMLVNKVIAEGEDVTKQFATKEREIVHKLDVDKFEEVRVTQDLETGAIRVEYESPDNVGEGAIDLVFKKGETTEDGAKIADEFYAVEPEPRVVNFDGDIEFDGENLVDNVEDLMSPTTRLKEISLGKKQTLKEYIDTKKKKDAVKKINEDKMAQINYVEKKYGPAPDVGDYGGGKDETIEVFENYQGKASGGIARMLGE